MISAFTINAALIPALPLIIAACSVGLIDVAMSPSHILDRIPVMLDSLQLPKWLSKPLYQCSVCHAGQWAFWTYLIGMWHFYHIGFHIVIVLLTIFFAKALSKFV